MARVAEEERLKEEEEEALVEAEYQKVIEAWQAGGKKGKEPVKDEAALRESLGLGEKVAKEEAVVEDKPEVAETSPSTECLNRNFLSIECSMEYSAG